MVRGHGLPPTLLTLIDMARVVGRFVLWFTTANRRRCVLLGFRQKRALQVVELGDWWRGELKGAVIVCWGGVGI